MRRTIGLAFVSLGLACLAWYAAQFYGRVSFQRDQNAALEETLADRSGSSSRAVRHGPLGRLEIPRLRLSTVVVEGDDEETLSKAVGHLPDTAMPWEPGNSAVAGHRDTFFRALKQVRPGDRIYFTSRHGRFAYRVQNTRVTTPDDVEVLASTSPSELTMITCYPFRYIGSAPNRYVVRAERIRDD
jgi:LPXTG-site transpeptidase (sortase) family protein